MIKINKLLLLVTLLTFVHSQIKLIELNLDTPHDYDLLKNNIELKVGDFLKVAVSTNPSTGYEYILKDSGKPKNS